MPTTKEFAASQCKISEETLASIVPLLDESEAIALLDSCGELGPDPSSKYFTERTKNIAYVMCLDSKWFQLRASCFIQPNRYNDFSGGYKRCYKEMPVAFLECAATQKVLTAFKAAYNIPDGELVLVQVQRSHVDSDNAGQCLTGQGIHSDGADRAMLVCLERENILGAENAIYADLSGKRALVNPFVLQEGRALLWHDNKVFHHVAPARVDEPRSAGSRTVLIAHYPAVHYLNGTVNPNNTLGTNKALGGKRLREMTGEHRD